MPNIDEKNKNRSKLYSGLLEEMRSEFSANYNSRKNDTWLYFKPKGMSLPDQGWKIHLSVIPPQGMDMIKAVSRYLFECKLHWKVLNSFGHLVRCTFGNVPLPQTGKFITIYIENPIHLEEHLFHLHSLTSGFIGPKIPTDKQFQKDSCVFFRYGAFKEIFFYDPYSFAKKYALYKKDGNLTEDKREPGFYKPSWVDLPFNLSEAEDSIPDEENAFISRGIKMIRVMKQSGKGGVYCIQTNKDNQCIMKEGRKNIQYDASQRTIKDRLINEYTILQHLEPLDITPKPIEIFEYSGNTFLLTEFIDGISLRDFVAQMHYQAEYVSETLDMIAHKLHRIVTLCHKQGIIIRDLSPNNILISDQLEIKLIDLELSFDNSSNQETFKGFTPGYVPIGYEEASRNRDIFDYYSLGAIYYFIATSLDPYMGLKSNDELLLKLSSYLHSIKNEMLVSLGEKGLKLMVQALQSLELVKSDWKVSYDPISLSDQGTLLEYTDHFINKLKSSMSFSNTKQLIFDHSLADRFHPANFNYGLSGISHFITEAAIITKNENYLNLAIDITNWIIEHSPFKPGETPIGLYFGYGYMPWLLTRLSILSNNHQLEAEAENIANLLVKQEINQYNISHGSAGLGLMFINLYQMTNNQLYLLYAKKMADHIISGMERDKHVLWKMFDNKKENKKSPYSLGYSHGIAGIGYFLAALYHETKEEEYLQLTRDIIVTLADTAIYNASKEGLLWKHSYGNDPKAAWTFWCNGSAGVGKFLLLVDELNLDHSAYPLSEKAINAVAESNIYGSNCQCHGLAGNADFLVQAFKTFHSNKIKEKIDEYLNLLGSLAILKEDFPLWTAEDKKTLSFDFMTGNTGIYSFLLRYHFDLPQPLSYYVPKEKIKKTGLKHHVTKN